MRKAQFFEGQRCKPSDSRATSCCRVQVGQAEMRTEQRWHDQSQIVHEPCFADAAWTNNGCGSSSPCAVEQGLAFTHSSIKLARVGQWLIEQKDVLRRCGVRLGLIVVGRARLFGGQGV